MNEADKIIVTILSMGVEQSIPVKDVETAKRLRDAIYATTDAVAIITVVQPCGWCGKHAESGGWHDECFKQYNLRSI